MQYSPTALTLTALTHLQYSSYSIHLQHSTTVFTYGSTHLQHSPTATSPTALTLQHSPAALTYSTPYSTHTSTPHGRNGGTRRWPSHSPPLQLAHVWVQRSPTALACGTLTYSTHLQYSPAAVFTCSTHLQHSTYSTQPTALTYIHGNYCAQPQHCTLQRAPRCLALPCGFGTAFGCGSLYSAPHRKRRTGTGNGTGTLAPRLPPRAPRCLAPVRVWHSLWLRKPLFRTAPQPPHRHRQRHRHAGPALAAPRPPLPCSRAGLAQPLAAEAFIPHRTATAAPAPATAPARWPRACRPAPPVALLPCGFGTAFGCGSLYSAPHRNRTAPAPATAPARWPRACRPAPHIALLPCGFGTAFGCGSLYSAPHRNRTAPATVATGTGALASALAAPLPPLLPCGFGTAFGCGSLYSAPHRNRRTGTGNGTGTLAPRLPPRAPRCLKLPPRVWHSLWLRKPLFRTAPQPPHRHRQRHRHAGPALAAPRPPLPCSRAGLAQPLAAEAFIPHRTATAPHRHRQRHRHAGPALAAPRPPLPCSRAGLAQPLAAEAFIPHRSRHRTGTGNGTGTLAPRLPPRAPRCLAPVRVWHSLWLRKPLFRTAPQPPHRHRQRHRHAGPALAAPRPPLPCSRAGLAQPLAAEAFIPHRTATATAPAHGNGTGTLAPRLPPRAPRCLAPVRVWHSLWLRKPLLRTAPQPQPHRHRQRHRHAGPALAAPRPPLPCSRAGLAQPLAAEAFIPHRNGTATVAQARAPASPHRCNLLPCGFGTAFGCGSLHSATVRQRLHRHGPCLSPTLPCSRAGLAQPLAAEAFIPHRTATAPAPATAPARARWPGACRPAPPVALLPCGFGTAFGCGSLHSAPHRNRTGTGNGTGTLAPRLLPAPPVALLPCGFGTAFGCGSLYSAPQRYGGQRWHRHWPCLSPRCLAPVWVWQAQPLAAEAFIPYRNGTTVQRSTVAQALRHWPGLSPRCLAPVWVWHSLWLRKPLSRTATVQRYNGQRWHRHRPCLSPRCLAPVWVWHSLCLRKPLFRTATVCTFFPLAISQDLFPLTCHVHFQCPPFYISTHISRVRLPSPSAQSCEPR